MEASSNLLADKVLWSKVLYLGSATAPFLWLAIALEYIGQGRLLTRRNVLLLMIVPSVILVTVWTNEAHQLIWQNVTLTTGDLYPLMAFTRGPLYWVNVVYGYTLMLVATVIMVRAFVRAASPYRIQAVMLLLAAFVPWIGNMLYIAGLTRDFTSVFFVVTGFIAALALFRYRLLDIVPVARGAIIASMSDAVMVFDTQKRLVDINRSAETLLRRKAGEVIGHPAAQVFANRAGLFEEYQDVEEAHTELTLDFEEGQRTFDLRLSPLRDLRGQLAGRVLVLRDISERKRVEAALQEAQRLAHIGNWSNDLTTGEWIWSDEIYFIMGVERQTPTDDLVASLLHPDDREPYFQEIDRAQAAHQLNLSVESRIIRPSDGEIRYIQSWLEFSYSPTGQALSRFGTVQDITLRVQAEEHVRQQNKFLENVLESVAAPFYVINVADYSIEMANSAAQALGVKIGAKTTCHTLTHQRDTPCEGEHPCPLSIVLETRAPAVAEHIHYDQDGRPLNVEVHGYPVFDDAGNVIQMIEYSIDITARKQAEDEVRKLSRAVEQSANSVVITNLAGDIEYVNPRFTQLTGYTVEEVMGRNSRILKSGKSPKEVYEQLWATISSGSEWRGEFLNRKKNGDLYWEAASISPIKDQTGEITHYLAIKEDVTARKAVEEALQRAYDRLSTLVEVDTELIVSLDVGQVMAVALDAAMRLSRANAGFIGRVDGEHVHVAQVNGEYPPDIAGTYIPPEASTIMAAVRGRQAILQTEVDNYVQRVTVLPTTRAQMTLPLLSHDELIGILNLETSQPERFTPEVFEFLKLLAAHAALAIDNAQLYENRAALIRDLDDFARTVAHDLKNPLNVVMVYGGMLDSVLGQLSEEMRQKAIEGIVHGANKMNSIIDALLLLAGVRQVGKVAMSPLDMVGIAAEVIQRLDTMIQEYQAEVILPATLPEAMGYAPWVEEVFANYLTNALKYGGKPPRIELGGDILANGMARFWIRDNGDGLTPEQQSQLFTQFTRLHQIEAEGHGLGLSIVQRIVEKLGGEVGVTSTVGQGSVFTFTLPYAVELERS